MVILAALTSIELYAEDNKPPRVGPAVLVRVPADGLCFWSCLYLAANATPRELWAWNKRSRNTLGFPANQEYAVEQDKVFLWALGLSRICNIEWPSCTKHRMRNKRSAEHEDMESQTALAQDWVKGVAVHQHVGRIEGISMLVESILTHCK